MNLKVLGSGSSGNCYLLENETECLVIEAGLPFKEVKKAIDFNIKKIKAVVISHEHGDHHRYWYQYVSTGIPVFEPFKNDGQTLWFNDSKFTIKAFELVHDVPCYGFYITHPEIGSLVYASDTEYVKYRFNGINHILVEANYDKKMIPDDAENFTHVLKGHCELQTALDFIKANDNENLKDICLIHLSERNANSDDFLNRAKEVTDKNVYIAKKGLVINLKMEDM